MPKQRINIKINDKELFMLFTRHIDHFYLFGESRVKLIQHLVEEICEKIIEEKQKYQLVTEDEENLFQKGDLVFG